MTKEEAKKSLFNTKVYVDGKSKEIQEKLFELGFKWCNDIKGVNFTYKPFLFLNGIAIISFDDDMENFEFHRYYEVSADYILNLKWDEDEDAKSEYEELVKIMDDIRGHYTTIVVNKMIMDEASKSIKENKSVVDEVGRLLDKMKTDTTDYEWNKHFFERVKNANKKYSLNGEEKVTSMIVDDIDNLINGSNRIISVLYHNHIDTPKTASDLNTFDRCLVCSGKGCVWIPEIYGYKSNDGKHYLIGHSVSSEHVIPYDESLRGKLYNKEDEK